MGLPQGSRAETERAETKTKLGAGANPVPLLGGQETGLAGFYWLWLGAGGKSLSVGKEAGTQVAWCRQVRRGEQRMQIRGGEGSGVPKGKGAR